MHQEKLEEKQKDSILQAINDELERQEWGGNHDKVVIHISFRGRFNLQPIEVQTKQRRTV